jgi:hypothetical protein
MTERLLLLGRPDCHLCEEFEAALLAHAGSTVALDHACVDERGEWRMRFGTRIPVLLNDAGAVLSEGVFDPTAFDRARRT